MICGNVETAKCDTAQSGTAGGEIFVDMAPGEDLNLPEENEESTSKDEPLVFICFQLYMSELVNE